MTVAEHLGSAADRFRTLVSSVGDDQWDLATPCDGWTVRQLVGHVASGSQMARLLADGGSREDAIATLSVDQLGDDPLAAIDVALTRQQEAFDRADIGDHIFHHPAGDMPGTQVIKFRLGDLLVHTWDLARAIGASEELDPALVEEVWAGIEPMIPMMAASGVFGQGPSGDVADDAPLQLRLLDAMGRRP